MSDQTEAARRENAVLGRHASDGDCMQAGKWRLSLRMAIVCLAIVGAVVAYRGLSAYRQAQVAFMVWFFLGLAFGLVWHEAGHLWAARRAGLPVHFLSVGIGPLLWRGYDGDVRLDLRLLPFSGFVRTYPLLILSKWRMFIFLLGGVLGNIAFIAFLALMAEVGLVPQSAVDPLRAIVAAQFYLIVANLVPFWAKVGADRVGSDGLQLLLLWTKRAGKTAAGDAYAGMLAPYVGHGSMPPAYSSASPRILHQVILANRYADGVALQAHREALERELAGHLSRGEELLVLDSLITTGLVSGEPGFRARLDEWSLRALQLGPEIETLRGSRGSVLVELGRWEEGKAMLAKVAAAEGSFDLFMIQIYLARAEHALGNAAEAERLGRAARLTGASSPESPAVRILLPRLEAELGIQPQQQTG